jgi:hypothetical protein
MIGFMVRTGVRMLSLAGFLYFTFFVELGPHTLYEHLSRIADTREAGELSGAVRGAVVEAYDGARQQLARLREQP